MVNGERSRAWSQGVPRLAADGLNDLAELQGECSPAQLNTRTRAFRKAERFVHNAQGTGVKAPVAQTFDDGPTVRPTDARLDLEVKRGLAFV
jgi:hypothetical protein